MSSPQTLTRPLVKGGLLRYIIPFWVELPPGKGFDRRVRALGEKGLPPVEEFEPWHHLYEYILDGLKPEGGGAPLGRAWTIPLEGERIGLHCDRPKAPIAHAYVGAAGLMLFTTGVGFSGLTWTTKRAGPSTCVPAGWTRRCGCSSI